MNKKADLIAPCGMNCGICRAYVENKCTSCRIRNKNCTWIKKPCLTKKISKGEIKYCCYCEKFPCPSLKKLDERYRKNYDMSMISNLKTIKSRGINYFIQQQEKKYTCPKCKKLISVHDNKCLNCV